MKNNTRQAGFGAVGLVVTLLVVGLLAFGGWFVWHKNQDKNDGKKNNTTSTQTPNDEAQDETQPTKSAAQLVDEALLKDCREVVVPGWAVEAGKTVDPDSVTVVKTKSGPNADKEDVVIKGDYARVASSCDTPALTASERTPGTITFLHKVDDTWKIYTKDQQAPACSKFDGKGWPAEVVPSCYEDSGTLRQVR